MTGSNKELWLPIPDFYGYEVSDLGNVRSYRSLNGRGTLMGTPHPIKQDKAKNKSYFRVSLRSNKGKAVHMRVHVLVLTVFKCPRPSPKHDGCHKDGNPENNRLPNLYWGTKKDNAADRIRHGTQIRGERQNLSKLTEQQAYEIVNHIPNWERGDGRKFALKFGVGDSTISAVKTRQTWTHIS